MIERKFVAQKLKEFEIQEYISKNLKNVGHSHTKMQKTPLGEKIIIYASRPGLIVGRKGQNIKQLTKSLKKRFALENPQIEISEIENTSLDANIVAENIVDLLERFGSEKFKAIGHRVMGDTMNAGALGIEITISGKIPSSRAKTWRFYSGYLKKCGDISITGVDRAYGQAKLKSGVVGVRVRIMPPTTKLPDHVEILEKKEEKTEATEKHSAAEAEPSKLKDEGKKNEKKPEKKKNNEDDAGKVKDENKRDQKHG